MDPCRCKGFTLIEVLIALLVLAATVAGSMAAQMAALRTRQSSALMSSAVQLAGSVTERMRASGHGRAMYLGLDYDTVRDGPPSASAPGNSCNGAHVCSAAALAEEELNEIRHAVHNGFPGGRIVVCRDAGAGQAAAAGWPCRTGPSAPVAVKIGWTERGTEAGVPARLAVALVTVDGAP